MPPATAQEVKTVTFYSVSPNLRIVRRPATTQFGQDGRPYPKDPEVTYEFEQRVVSLKEGADVLPDGPDGEPQDAVAFLRNHFCKNTPGSTGFYEDGDEPGRLRPTEDEMIDRVMASVSVLERDGAVAVLGEERATHKRALVIAAAEKAIDRIDQANRALAAQAEAIPTSAPLPPPESPPPGG